MGDARRKMKLVVDLDAFAAALALSGRRYVRVRDVAGLLGVSTRSAGRLLARLEQLGYVKRYSRTAFRVSAGGGDEASQRVD